MKYFIVLLSLIVQWTSGQILSNVPSSKMAIGFNDRGLLSMLRNNAALINDLAITSTASTNTMNKLASLNTATKAAAIAGSNLINVNTSPTIPKNINNLGSEKLTNTNFIPEPKVFQFLREPINKHNIKNKMWINNNAVTGLKRHDVNLKIGNPCNCKHGKISNQDFGLQIVPDNLEILGTVIVTGKIPLNGVVAINGNLPTNGQGSVNFSCGSRTNSVSL